MNNPGGRWLRCLVVLALVGLMAVLTLAAAPDAQMQSSTASRIPPQKQAVLDREAIQIAAARNAPQPPKGGAGTGSPPNVQPEPGRLLGTRIPAGQGIILESGFSPLGSAFEGENRWYEQVGTEDLAVFAGALRSDPTQGLVVVWMSEIRTGKDGSYPTPTKAGSIHVVAAVGERLTLSSTSGVQFVFDVQVAERSVGDKCWRNACVRTESRHRTRIYALLRSGDLVALPGSGASDDEAALRIDRSSVERWAVLEFHALFRSEGVEVQQEVTHGNAVGIYFFDPEGNRNEVYWQTGRDVPQPFRKSLNLDQSADDVLAESDQLVHAGGPAYQPATAGPHLK